MKFIDEDGSIIIPKSVRPIVEYPQTILGSRRGALRQFRNGKLHIRDYGSHYSVHSDNIDPLKDPMGHLIVDAPEYLVGMLLGISVYSALKDRSVKSLKNSSTDSNSFSGSSVKIGSPPPHIAGILAAYAGYAFTKSLKKIAQRRR